MGAIEMRAQVVKKNIDSTANELNALINDFENLNNYITANPAENIYNADGALTSNRQVDFDGFTMQWIGLGEFYAEATNAPTVGNASFEFAGYGTSNGDVVFRESNGAGAAIRESFGDKNQNFYGFVNFNSFNTARIGKNPNAQGIIIEAPASDGTLKAGWSFGFNGGELVGSGDFGGGTAIQIINSTSDYAFATLQNGAGTSIWLHGMINSDYLIRGYVPSLGDYKTFLKANKSNAVLEFPYGVTKHNGLTTTQKNALTPEVGMVVFDSTLNRYEVYSDFWGWIPMEGFTADMGYETMDDLFNTAGSIWQQSSVNGGAINNISGPSGILIGTTLTATNGGFLYRTNLTSVAFGSSIHRLESLIKIPTNSDGTNTFQVLSGFIDSQTTNQTNGAYFLYDAQGVSTGSTASGNWQCVTVNAGVRTFTTTTVTIDNTNFQKLRIDVNSAGTEVKFYIAGVLVATHTTNVPIANMGSGNYIQKSAGTTSRTFQLDFVRYKTKYNTAR